MFPIAGRDGQFVAMFDRWNKTNLIDSRYVWLPLIFEKDKPVIEWNKEWTLN